MAYYIRVLTPEPAPVPVAVLRKAVERHGASVSDDGDDPAWRQIVVVHPAGRDVCVVERNEVTSGSLGAAEIEEFLDEAVDLLPASGAQWLQTYLPKVRTIYAFQLLPGADVDKFWEIVGAAREAVHQSVGDIIQADNEGFSNEEGYHILWQFSEGVEGDWWMAVLKDGQWRKFKMDLGSKAHRAAFQAGDVPDGVEIAE